MSADTDDGPRGAAASLAAMLREAMVSRQMRQSELARAAGVSAGTISNVLNARRTPTLDTLDLLARALTLPADQVRTLHGLRDRADSRDRRLDAYLFAAQRAAREHPYPGVIPGLMPPLTTIYVKQQALQLQSNSHEADVSQRDSTTHPQAADDSLPEGESYVILAGPGGGKSSLLRTLLATSVDQWLAGRGGTSIPVLISASSLLEGPLTRAVAVAATRELKHFGLTEPLESELFASPPQPGCIWTIYLDGLDEVTDADARMRVLQTIAAVQNGPNTKLYRFVLATRPLPQYELDVLGDTVKRFELQPFTVRDTQKVAVGWFRALALADPEAAAEVFAKALERTKIVELARIPLMVSMLCQLHAAAPDQPLPASRARIYDAFIGLLHLRQHSDRTQEMAHDLSGLDRFGARDQGEQFLAELPKLISRIAGDLYEGTVHSVSESLATLLVRHRGSRVPAELWERFVHATLRRSGIFGDRMGELVFLHQTLLEYFAARHAVRTPGSAGLELRRTFRRYGLRGTGETPAASAAWLSLRFWRPPTDDPSYVGFLVEAADGVAPRAAHRCLSRLARRDAGLPGYEFIAEQVRLGTRIPDGIVELAANRSASIASNNKLPGWQRVSAAALLTRQLDQRGADLLQGLSRDTSISGWSWIHAAEVLISIGDPRGTGRLFAIATDTAVPGKIRVSAARFLTWAGDPRGIGQLRTLVADIGLADSERVGAAAVLIRFRDRRGMDLMHELADDPDLEPYAAIIVGDWLAAFGETAGIERLCAVARNRAVSRSLRLDAAERLYYFDTDIYRNVMYELKAEGRLSRLNEKLGDLFVRLVSRHFPLDNED